LYNYTYCDDFTESKFKYLKEKLFPDVPDDNLIDGIPLTQGALQYIFKSNTTTPLIGYMFFDCQRELVIKAGSVNII